MQIDVDQRFRSILHALLGGRGVILRSAKLVIFVLVTLVYINFFGDGVAVFTCIQGRGLTIHVIGSLPPYPRDWE